MRTDVFCMIIKAPISFNRDAQRKGYTLVEIMIAVSIVGLLAAISVPQFLRHREFANKNACIENLRQIAAAKAIWAQEQNKSNSHTPAESDLFGATNYVKEKPRCPSGGDDYMTTIGTVGEAPKCSRAGGHGHILAQ
jgi:prepilin-type N-terminal cleavage/methylation domain-containing protein